MRKLLIFFCICALLFTVTACQNKSTQQESIKTSEDIDSEPTVEISEPVSSEESSIEESSNDESSMEETAEAETSTDESSENGDADDGSPQETSEGNYKQHIVPFDPRGIWDGRRYVDVIKDLASFIDSEDPDIENQLISQGEELYALLPDEALSCAYPLEGYLLPLDYELDYIGLSYVQQILQSALDTIQEYIDASGTDMSIHEVLTRASIVQIEAMRGGESDIAYPEVMPHIASVIENRLNSGTPLQMDVTYRYAQFLLENTDLSEDEALAYDTYEVSALPPGPICTPSIEAIQAVLAPEESEDLFFVYDADGNYYFASTYEEHLINCEKAGIY